MKVIKYPQKSEWSKILARPAFDTSSLNATVSSILAEIKSGGDKAVISYEEKFDKVQLSSLSVSEKEIEDSDKLLSEELKSAIRTAKDNIEKFHTAQKFEPKKIETTAGVVCWQKAVGIEKVGLYVPGGTAPLFSTVLMLAVPAKIAGCREIVLCTPPDKDGNVNPAILYAAKVAGVNKIFKIGGVQAIGAMAYGTESVPKVYKIFGPGNQYVVAAKQLVSLKEVAIDMPAGPSEVQVIADETANPAFIASDLLSQAEHGVDSQVILTTTNENIIQSVVTEIEKQLAELPRKEIAEKALQHSIAILLDNEEELIELTNEYAPEHLIIETKNYIDFVDKIINAGSVFLGHYTPESAGDYASGTNHTLPTNGHAKAYSGVNLDSFVKKITFQEISKEGIKNLGSTIEIMAENELLFAHKNAVTLRLK
ncbi:histidinol dehydrogenase [Dysgonomonas sp. HDW5A]|uniref:histidinol dehydrogenase n=1 Tax=Dysgonomonas sp. HDW5A TaxID=2714926 RepID=UPI00140CFD47|nr:histidinol dehydrogenase [Dysgonomonas sp. HDW5A]QIK58525.1 histidinol dehydrogenase [Dysgonomonas sp. HDW5A]